jgi:hypothetical protein
MNHYNTTLLLRVLTFTLIIGSQTVKATPDDEVTHKVISIDEFRYSVLLKQTDEGKGKYLSLFVDNEMIAVLPIANMSSEQQDIQMKNAATNLIYCEHQAIRGATIADIRKKAGYITPEDLIYIIKQIMEEGNFDSNEQMIAERMVRDAFREKDINPRKFGISQFKFCLGV